MTKRQEFGLFVKAARQQRGYTLHRLSEMLGYRSIGAVNNIELGLAPVPIEKIHPLAEALQISLDELLAKIEECEPELYAKYRIVEKGILRRFMGQLLGKGTSGSMGLKDLFPALLLTFSLAFGPAVSEAKSLHMQNYPEPGVDQSIHYQNFRRLIRRLREAILGVTGPAYA